MKRFVKEYANDKIRNYQQIAADSPRLLDECASRIERIRKAVSMYERYMITEDETIREILEA